MTNMKNEGFEIRVIRKSIQKRTVGVVARTRTVGTYAVYIDGVQQPGLRGTMAEQKGPSDNSSDGAKYDRRIAPGRYPLWTQNGTKYKTFGYLDTPAAQKQFKYKPRPGIELKETGKRAEILIHPASGFLSSEGCMHPSNALADGNADIDHAAESRPRVLALIKAMKDYCGNSFPKTNGKRLPNCWCVVEDDFS
ncbi:MAG TPA: hypothetical protein PLQ11_02745 [Beijerinckiaceae bacterium]|nr:hypothetical protein [Beijerinckiaceae bacterium]